MQVADGSRVEPIWLRKIQVWGVLSGYVLNCFQVKASIGCAAGEVHNKVAAFRWRNGVDGALTQRLVDLGQSICRRQCSIAPTKEEYIATAYLRNRIIDATYLAVSQSIRQEVTWILNLVRLKWGEKPFDTK